MTSQDSAGNVSEAATATLVYQLGKAGTDFAAPTLNLNDDDGIITASEYTHGQA